MFTPQPFKVNIGQPILDDLKSRILNTHWMDPIPGKNWQYGADLSYMRELSFYWATNFNWRNTKNTINGYPGFIVQIDDYKIHYLHIKSKKPDAIPLIITHGWPGSFLEMLNIIPLLTESKGVSFDLIIPSAPGFGFSEKPGRQGITISIVAQLWVKLMTGLGYNKFIAQGGDFGAFVSSWIALNYPDRLIGLHLNYIPWNYKPYLPPGEELTKEETEAQQKTNKFFQQEGGYAAIQTTKPLTLSYGLNDSPVGLCAWILQIFHSFSDPASQVEELFNRDELLAHISLYWITGTIHSSMRLYSEGMKEPMSFAKDDFIHVPTGIAHYPYPDSFPAKKYVEREYNVQYWKDMPRGGHFAAMEQPGLFAKDIKEFTENLLVINE